MEKTWGSGSRRTFLIGSAIATLSLGLKSCIRLPRSLSDRLASVGNEFSFALVADPQLSLKHPDEAIYLTAQQKLSDTVLELNAAKLPFVIFNGDMVAEVDPAPIKNFLSRIKPLEPLPILVHGNHDGGYPYNEFKQMQQTCNGTEDVYFSFDCGKWHFVTFPCKFRRNQKYQAALLDWLAQDLQRNRDRPTLVFEHLHLLPLGLTQLSWYTYDKPFKQKVLEILTRHGNVRTVICGHVHNGIQTSIKTAWTYQGIHFISAPTCTASRNFGEEYSQFQSGAVQSDVNTGGGYYLLIDIKNDDLQIRGRLVGVADEYVYPKQFKPYQNEDAFWFQKVSDRVPAPALTNASFESGLQDWLRSYRYQTDVDPGFVAEAVSRNGGRSAYLFCREKGRVWAYDEVMELYQWVSFAPSSILAFQYQPEVVIQGGGYVCLSFYRGKQLKRIMMFDWSDGKKGDSTHVSQNALYLATDQRKGALALSALGKKKKALFWELPATPQPHSVQINLAAFHDRAAQAPGKFAQLNLDRVLVTLGVWCLPEARSQSGVWFDAVALQPDPLVQAALVIDGQEQQEIGAIAFQTSFGESFGRLPSETKERSGT